jgi:hypothetical protein
MRQEERSRGNRLGRNGWLLVVAGLPLVAVLAVTRFGLGVSTDSVAYIAEARSFRDGRPLELPVGIYEIYEDVEIGRDSIAAAHFPPLFPVVLALGGADDDPASSGRALNALLLAATVLLVAFMVERHTGSRGAALLAASFIALSPALLRTHAMVWSEPLFIALGVLGLLVLARYLEEGRVSTLVTASVVLGLAWLTRYAGIAFVLTGVLVLAVAGPRPRKRRIVLLLVISSVPMAAFLIAMAFAGASGGGYTLAPHVPALPVLQEGAMSLRTLVLPGGMPSLLTLLAWLPVVAIVVAVLVRRTRTPSGRSDTKLAALPLVLYAFLPVYAAVLFLSLTTFAEPVSLEERMFVPVYVVAVALLACTLGRGLSKRRLARGTVLFVLAGLLVANSTAGAVLVRQGVTEERGFTSPSWASSDGGGRISALPRSTRIYSNFPEAVYITAGRSARLLPKLRLSDGRANPRYAAQLAQVAGEVRDGRGAVVFFTVGHRDHLPGVFALTNALGTAPSTADAVSYHWTRTP